MVEQGDLELFKRNTGKYVIKFDTDKESIDAGTLADALLAYKHTIQELAASRTDSEEVLVDVEVVDRGCIEIHTLITAIQSVVNPETLPAIVTGIKSVVDIYRFLKGKLAKKVEVSNSDDAITLTNVEGSKIVINKNVYNVYLNTGTPPFGDARNYGKDRIKSVRMMDGENNESVRINESEFGSFEKCNRRIQDADVEEREEELELVVATIPLGAPKNQWSFILAGELIRAQIKDDSFIGRIERHEITFGKGDRIVARVLTRKEFDPQLNCMKIKSRKVLRVVRRIKVEKPTEAKLV